MGSLVHRPEVAEEHSHLGVVEAARRVGVEEAQMRVGAEHTLRMRRTAFALGVVPFAVVVPPIASLHALIERPRGDRRSELWHGLLGLRLGRWGRVNGQLWIMRLV